MEEPTPFNLAESLYKQSQDKAPLPTEEGDLLARAKARHAARAAEYAREMEMLQRGGADYSGREGWRGVRRA